MPANPKLVATQWKVILQVASILNEADITYNIDASSVLFVHGIDIEMDDVDIIVQWDGFHKTHALFSDFNPTKISDIKQFNWKQFRIYIDGVEVHFMGGEKMTDLASEGRRAQVNRNNITFWSKSVEFCRSHLPDDHEWAPLVDAYLAKKW